MRKIDGINTEQEFVALFTKELGDSLLNQAYQVVFDQNGYDMMIFSNKKPILVVEFKTHKEQTFRLIKKLQEVHNKSPFVSGLLIVGNKWIFTDNYGKIAKIYDYEELEKAQFSQLFEYLNVIKKSYEIRTDESGRMYYISSLLIKKSDSVAVEEEKIQYQENEEILKEILAMSIEIQQSVNENTRVTAENNQLMKENNRLTAENNQLMKENNRLSAENNKMLLKIDDMVKQNQILIQLSIFMDKPDDATRYIHNIIKTKHKTDEEKKLWLETLYKLIENYKMVKDGFFYKLGKFLFKTLGEFAGKQIGDLAGKAFDKVWKLLAELYEEKK